MTVAEIHRKTPLIYSEDLLTADVFTAFRYLPPHHGAIGFLRSVEGIADILPAADNNSTCEVHFWPLGLYCNREPDLLLELDIRGRLFSVVVEAKYLSGPSDGPDTETVHQGKIIMLGNQLADQYRDLRNGQYLVWRGATRDRRKRLSSRVGDRFELYLTSHLFRPREDLDLCVQYCPEASGRLFWANWYHVYEYLASTKDAINEFPYNRIIDDICILLHEKGFSSFHGVTKPPEIEIGPVSGSFWKG